MLKPEQIPETAAHAAEAAVSIYATWQHIIAAANNAWPGMIDAKNGSRMSLSPQIILPLPKEPEA